ncbi:MAG: hypothetical protein R2704_13915 [Microthrixaceae bacterium]
MVASLAEANTSAGAPCRICCAQGRASGEPELHLDAGVGRFERRRHLAERVGQEAAAGTNTSPLGSDPADPVRHRRHRNPPRR